jgi:mannose-1-phosphate guanylyltransferase
MKGFILAAGYGERLRPLTSQIPKPLVPVAGIPSICYSLALLKQNNINEIVCNLHYMHDDVMDFFRRNRDFGFTLEISVEKELLGTGGGVKKCQPFLKGDDFLLLNSDIITDLDLGRMIHLFHQSGKKGMLSLFPLDEGGLPGTVSLKKDLVVDFNRTLASGIAPLYDYMGAALLTPAVFDYLLNEHSSIVKTGYSSLAKGGELGSFVHNGLWMDIGSLEKLHGADTYLQGEGAAFLEGIREVLGDIK